MDGMEGAFPQVVLRVLGVPIRDTVLSTWALMIAVIALVYVVQRRQPEALEMLVKFVLDTGASIMRRPAEPYLPLLGSLVIFIAVSNAFGVVPVFVAPTRDINTPLALALIVAVAVHYYGVREKGFVGYLKDLANPIFTFPLELIGQVSRTMSLTLRLFGNVISTEIIIAVVSSLVPLIAPLLFIAFSMFTGALQAYIFTVVAAVYIASAVETD
jgi:F-type H+-transporting ATPase subunit a